ncbi:23S ribosomal RNA methyltransferase [Coniochaeta ligniaria NRRL 30616]|uniref:rRNA methyltransferase 2, mitochondrial n=1 Tax=Coniochaeta ligniaria NRRL 30616 TaxID=1408157 RepID=A0A1J7J6N3_9PEZI|nr:23S ribosomal RNA methyltransferase [Coniochaeta ligniaria NRRL 30616]
MLACFLTANQRVSSSHQYYDFDFVPSVHVRRSSSNSRWKQRQGSDVFAREAKVQGLKSRAAFKLLEMDAKYQLFRKGAVVVDLGYAPGSWSQVAKDRTGPKGLVVGIDLIPAQPPRGVSTIQGNFLSPSVRNLVKTFVAEGAARKQMQQQRLGGTEKAGKSDVVLVEQTSYIDAERLAARDAVVGSDEVDKGVEPEEKRSVKEERLVDVVLSDMSAPWPQTHGFTIRSLSNPYRRMMNTSGITFRDHAGSMDLCYAALSFASDTLKAEGNFVCKFYQGKEDKALENKLKKMFKRVCREKPESSRSESKEAYFVALRRKANVTLDSIEAG